MTPPAMTPPVRILRQSGAVPVVDRPDPARVIAGDPVFTTWNVEDAGGLFCGFWHSTPGTFRVSYTEWEYVRILEGYSVLTDQTGNKTHLRPGDSAILRPGFQGTWAVIEPTLKEYVIRE